MVRDLSEKKSGVQKFLKIPDLKNKKNKKIQFLQQIDAVIENQCIFHTWSRRRKCRRSSCEVVK
jgi:hypothetical protein